MMRLLFMCCFSFNAALFAQSSTVALVIPDSCVFVRIATESTFNSVTCLDNKFRVYLNCPLDSFAITIFNKSGDVVFNSTNIDEFWPANNCEDGEYYWKITGQMIFENEPVAVEKNGRVAVLR